MPAEKEFLLRREFITAQLHSHFETVGVKITEVLHTWSDTQPELLYPQITFPFLLS